MMDGGRMRRRILHTADLHLLNVGDRACQSLEAVVDQAIKTRVDLVIVAGDFFDTGTVADNLIGFAVEQLRRLSVPAVILPGNHDCLLPGSVFDRAEPWQDCDNIRILRAPDGEMLDLADAGVLLWGKPHDSYGSDLQPLAGIPVPHGNGRWHIALAHGYYIEDEASLFRAYHITEEEIITSGWDYIALGHVPAFKCVSDEPVKTYYPGSPSISGTVAIVDLDERTGVQVNRCVL
jgi:DNA repair exonuclease SbcCD nuclease subunit